MSTWHEPGFLIFLLLLCSVFSHICLAAVLKCASLKLCASALNVGHLQSLAVAFFIIRSSVTATSFYSQDISLLNSFHPVVAISFLPSTAQVTEEKQRLEMAI